MNPENTPQWAIIELMGHIRYGGLVSKDTQLGTSMLRVDVPEGENFVSQLVNPNSIYRLTMCSEQLARAACAGNSHRPLNSWEMPTLKIGITQGCAACDRGDFQLGHADDCPKNKTSPEDDDEVPY